MTEYFTKGRRELIAKTLANIVQIAAGASLAGELFIKLPALVKIIAVIVITVLFILAIIICPKRSDE